VIYRRLWHIPASGIAALLRKQVSNELLMSYLGEVQFLRLGARAVEHGDGPLRRDHGYGDPLRLRATSPRW
jgi:hypothetical protein